MGLFSRKDKASRIGSSSKPQLNSSQSNASLNSGSSSLKSPTTTIGASSSGRLGVRTSAGPVHSSSGPNTPLTPFSPFHIPRIDLPKPPDPALDPSGYLRSLGAIRERCKIVTDKALRNDLRHFDVDMSKFGDVVSFVCGIIKVRD